MKNHDKITAEVERKYREKDRRKRKRMKVSGKSVFALQKIMSTNIEKKLLKLKKA